MNLIKNNRGQSLLEVIVALAIFALIAAAMVTMATGGFVSLGQGGEQTEAQALAQEAIEGVRAIRDRAWNEIIYTTSSVSIAVNKWQFDGEGLTDTVGKYTRSIRFDDVCRDGSNVITACPGIYTDLHSKKITVTVSWEARSGVENYVEQVSYLTNWDSREWKQTDWVGGSGQSIWSDATRFDSADSGVEYSAVSGQITLASQETSTSSIYHWTFSSSADYVYDANKIEVTGGAAQLKLSGGGGINGINDTPVDTLEYDTGNGQDPDIINVSGNIYLVAFRGPNNDGWVKTVNIDSSGNIGAAAIDSLEFDTSDGAEPNLIQITSSVYAVAYRGSGNDGWVKTFTVDGSGNISNATVDSLEFDTSNGYEPDIIQVGTGYYAVAYRGVSDDGFVKSFTIDNSGNIGNAVIDTLEWDTADGFTPKIIQVGSGYYAVVYRGTSGDGFAKTFTINSTGVIGNAVIDTLEWDTADGYYPDIINVSGTMYAVAYSGTGSDGFVVTFTIDGTGNIANTITDSFEHNTTYSASPDIKFVSDNTYLVVYQSSNNPGSVQIDIFDIETSGDIAAAITDTWIYDTNVGLYPKLINVGGLYWAVAYEGDQNDGYLVTLSLGEGSATYPTDNPTITPTSSLSVVSTTQWTSFAETATKNGGEIYYQLSSDNGSTWLYWDGSVWATAGPGNYNIASDINTNITSFTTSTNQIMFKAFLSSDGTQQVILDNVSIGYESATGAAAYSTIGVLTSSAFNMSDGSPVQILSWDEDVSGCATCDIQMQLRVAPDTSGSPGTWSSWYGSTGAGTYYTNPLGTLLSTVLNWGQWVQYRVELVGDGSGTPVLSEVRVNYK